MRRDSLWFMRAERNEKYMYKKAMSLLLAGNLVLLSGFVCVREAKVLNIASQPAATLRLELEELEEKAKEKEASMEQGDESGGVGIADVAVSGQRVVDFQVMERTFLYTLGEEDLEVLLRIVEAEAGGEDEDGKLLVANVVLNRVRNENFPETVKDVVFQQENGVTQFSPVSNGSYYKVQISEETVSAVERALSGEDISQGALYFAARQYADSEKMKWFDSNLTFLFEYGGHEFFK